MLFGGRCTVAAGGLTFEHVGKRANPFAGKPHAVYLPANTSYTITARGNLDAGLCSAPSDLRAEPYLIAPEQVTAHQMGAASFSRELRNILEGQVALVTGGDKGLGQAMAIALAQAGADVAVVSRSGHNDASLRAIESVGRPNA
ncbi:MAG TPA: SDR family NAD(P)-dependent oxidoreductase [Roseiflexaceae bacterium]|nr:SDR family NAD(P)-dependent oxidoreductase [Roseiflexaceae bacterium]